LGLRRWTLPGPRRERLVLLALAVLAAVPRLFNLLALDPFVDEVNWVRWAVDRFDPGDPSTYWVPIVQDGRPPLYFWLTLLTTRLVDNGFVAGRLAAVVPDIGSTLGLYVLGRLVISPQVGMLGGILWAVSPFNVFLARIASDDPLLTLCAMLVAISGVVVVRRPGWGSGVFCGLAVGLAIYAKTLGLLAVATPAFAILTLAAPRSYRRFLWPALAAMLVAALLLMPLVPWLLPLATKAARHADLGAFGAASPAGGGGPVVAWLERLINRDLFLRNLDAVRHWVPQYTGLPFVALGALGLILAGVGRQRGLRYLVLIVAFGVALTLAHAKPLYSRYLLVSSFPLYLLAAAALVWLTTMASRVISRVARHRDPALAVRAALLAGGLALTVAPMLSFTVPLITVPERAPLPVLERVQYLESWFALYGLARVVQFLGQEAQSGPVTVLVPATPGPFNTLITNALRLYLRGDHAVSFTAVRALDTGDSLSELRDWLTGRAPTFVVTNGTHKPDPSPAVSSYTRKVEVALARDLPEARLVVHIPRPSGSRWLNVYRLDQSAASTELIPAPKVQCSRRSSARNAVARNIGAAQSIASSAS
jgi:4-amino-4-deoxy-L-arabinose transferase-like glycosyltransferase